MRALSRTPNFLGVCASNLYAAGTLVLNTFLTLQLSVGSFALGLRSPTLVKKGLQ